MITFVKRPSHGKLKLPNSCWQTQVGVCERHKNSRQTRFYLTPTVCKRVCRLFLCRSHTPTWVCQHEFATLSLPCEGRLTDTFENVHVRWVQCSLRNFKVCIKMRWNTMFITAVCVILLFRHLHPFFKSTNRQSYNKGGENSFSVWKCVVIANVAICWPSRFWGLSGARTSFWLDDNIGNSSSFIGGFSGNDVLITWYYRSFHVLP